ncbi:MAG: NHL repeat-containing protein [Candidatus Aminicenantes bacterium]|nr:NHL repeat-containing protein [Candidatus Aminicenantes bacterium]
MTKKIAVIIVFTALFASVFYCPSLAWGDKIPDPISKAPGTFSPVRITFNPDGNLIVSEYKRGLIVTLDRTTLGVVSWFPIDGKPLGVASINDYILVGNETRGCVEAYRPNGRKLAFAGAPVQKPVDIVLDKGLKTIFVVDGGEKSIKVLSFKGKLLFKIPASPPDANILTNPTGIALDAEKQELYVSDYGDQAIGIHARVQIFDLKGNLTGTISGKEGMFGQRFSRPQGLAVDGRGHLLMIDCFSAEILVFDLLSGAIIKTFGEYGMGPGQLRLPFDLVVDPVAREIFVTNNRCSRIEVFRNARGF